MRILGPKLLFLVLFFGLCCGCSSKKSAQKKAESKQKDAGVGVGASSSTQSELARQWPTFRQNNRRTGRAWQKGPRQPSLKWVFRTQGRIYADAAVSADGIVYVASHDHHLYAVSAKGRELWRYDARGKIWTSPALAADGTIYFGSDADRLIALAPSGEEKWVASTEQNLEKGEKPETGRWDVDSSPAIADDGTIFFGCHTLLYALRSTGGIRWLFEAGVGRAKIFSSPAIGPDQTIYFGTQGNYFFALSQSSKVLWYKKTEGDNDSTAAVGDDGTVYFGSDDGKLRAAVGATGEIKWELALGRPIRAPLAIGADNTVFVSVFAEQPYLAAVDGKNGQEKWRFHIQPGQGAYYGIQSGALVDSEGYVYFGGRDKFVYCLSPTGNLVWKYETGDQVDAGPVMGPDGTLYIGSDDRRLYAFAGKPQ